MSWLESIWTARVASSKIIFASPAAKVVINARTGSVVMNQSVTLEACAISHGNLSVTIGAEPQVMTPEQFSAYVRTENDRYSRLIPELGIK